MSIIDSIQLSGVTYQIQGEITVDAALDSGSTNPVANSAITTALDNKVNVVDNEVPDYNVTSQITYQGGYPSQSETASTWADATIYTLRYNFVRMSDTDFTTTAAVIDPSGNITTGNVTISETNIGNPLPDYIDMSFDFDDSIYRFIAKEGYRIAHLDVYISRFGSYGAIIEERVETVFEGGQSADVIKDVIEPTLINKQDQLVSGTNIKTINNTSILGSGNIDIQGGGKAIEAGRGISITTGETADTVSFNLPISAGTGTNSIAEGRDTTASGNYSHAEGRDTRANGYYSHAEGDNTRAYGSSSHAEGTWTTAGGGAAHAEGSATEAYGDCSHTEGWNTTAYNQSEHASGQYNVSSNASTTFGNSGNTLFSVGNGVYNAPHNAFEIRQNGDIYLTKDGQDVKLQDHLGGGGSTYTAGDGIDITNDVISVTGKADTSAVTEVSNALTAHTADTTIHVTSAEKATWNAKSDFSGSYNDLTNKLSAGTNITIVDNVISAEGGGGGKAIEAGRGISITTGATADTVSFDLPISATTNGSILIGVRCSANRDKSFVGGQGSVGQGEGSFAFGQYCKAGQWSIAVGNQVEANITSNTAAFGKCNKQNGGFFEPESATTLFSVGNGTSISARHNAFEIRQNGDIYLSSGGTDIKLQDHLGGGGSTYTAGDGIDITNDVISVTGKVDTSTYNTYTAATDTALASKQTTLTASTGISIVDNVISATGGGMTEDDELLLSTALVDLNERKIDVSEVKSNYQKKGDYVTTSTLNTRLAEYETALDEQNVEEVTAYALNDLNDRFGGLKIVKISETEYEALTTKDENTLYIVVADPS